MKEIFLGFVFDEKKAETLLQENTFGLQIATNQYQIGFLKGLKKKIQIISVLPTGTYPNKSKKLIYSEDVGEIAEGTIKYIPFVNTYFLKDYCQKKHLLKEMEKQITGEETVIYVYSLYIPFLSVLKKIRKKFANVHICLIVPDLPGKYGIMRKTLL